MTDLPNAQPESRSETLMIAPDKIAKVRDLFGVDSDMEVPAFSEPDERVPDLDPTYVFDPDTTVEALSTNIEFMEWARELPFNFCRVELYAGTPLLERMKLEGPDRIGFIGCRKNNFRQVIEELNEVDLNLAVCR